MYRDAEDGVVAVPGASSVPGWVDPPMDITGAGAPLNDPSAGVPITPSVPGIGPGPMYDILIYVRKVWVRGAGLCGAA